jgi:diguanylate cyclase (GGDEF)-like protein
MANRITTRVAQTEHHGASATADKSRFGGLWVVGALLLVLLGTTLSVLAARAVAHDEAQKAHRAFASSSAEVSSRLKLALQHEEDLVVSTSAFVVTHPEMSNAAYNRWLQADRAFERYPEILSLSRMVVVKASELPAFAKRAQKDPAGRLGPDGTFQVVPPGARPFYCFADLKSQSPSGRADPSPAGLDICDNPAGARLLPSRDSGVGIYEPFRLGKLTVLGIETPIYRHGIVPTTVAARRATFIGWVGIGLMPAVVLKTALYAHPGVKVILRFKQGSSQVAFNGGNAPHGAQTLTTDLHNGWTVQTFSALPSSGVFASAGALALLVGGIVVTLLIAVLGAVLATGRARALRHVDKQTIELQHQALHDALTGLPNRALIADRIQQLLARNRREKTHGAVLFVDLDEFKNVNDTLGHDAGDRLLIAVAARLTSTLRDADTIGRMGGDEFVVLVDGSELDVAPELVAKRLLEVMRQPFELEGAGLPLVVNTSIGIAVGDRTSVVEFLRDADVALYQAKAAGKNRFAVFHPEMQTEISRRGELEFALRSALADDQFRLVYQPTYNLDDLSLVGVEALLRWDHPAHGRLQPDDFIPILEQTGQIEEVGHWVLREACQQMATWHRLGDALDISVNISGRQLDSDAVIEHIQDALQSSGLDPGSLIIEVTETALVRDAGQTAKRLHAIKQLGVRIAVDDFGTGYSSLAYLEQFPVDSLKIDRAFTNAITTSPESKALIKTLVQLGKDLGLTTLAEGVENTGQIDYLRNENVDEAQGFLFSQPLDAATLEIKILAPARPRLPGPARQ